METSLPPLTEQVSGRSVAQGLIHSSFSYLRDGDSSTFPRHTWPPSKKLGKQFLLFLNKFPMLHLEPIASFLLPMWSLESGFVSSIMTTVSWPISCPSAFPSPSWASPALTAPPCTSCALAPDQHGGLGPAPPPRSCIREPQTEHSAPGAVSQVSNRGER